MKAGESLLGRAETCTPGDLEQTYENPSETTGDHWELFKLSKGGSFVSADERVKNFSRKTLRSA